MVTKDSDILKYADDFGLILITKDQDFRHSFMLKKQPKKLIKINLGNISNELLFEVLSKQIDLIEDLDKMGEPFLLEINSEIFWVLTK